VTRAAHVPGNIAGVAFAEPIHDSFALVPRRGAKVSPGTLSFIDLVHDWAQMVKARLGTG
jgi:hypothetical protein